MNRRIEVGQCRVDGCEKMAARARAGYCRMHRARLERHGSVDGLSPKKLTHEGTSVMRRLVAGVVADDDCWIWGRGKSGGTGYGRLVVGGRNRGTHVLMWEQIHQKKVPPGMYVCHSCDVRACINPVHLWLGTPTDNVRDARAKGRLKQVPETACNVPECGGDHYSLGLCRRHYSLFRRSPLPDVRARLAPFARPAPSPEGGPSRDRR